MTAHSPTPPPTTWTVTGNPHRITPVTVTLIIAAVTNLIALATLTTIVLDGPPWLVVTFTVATVALAAAARHSIRVVPETRSPTT